MPRKFQKHWFASSYNFVIIIVFTREGKSHYFTLYVCKVVYFTVKWVSRSESAKACGLNASCGDEVMFTRSKCWTTCRTTLTQRNSWSTTCLHSILILPPPPRFLSLARSFSFAFRRKRKPPQPAGTSGRTFRVAERCSLSSRGRGPGKGRKGDFREGCVCLGES